MTQNNKKEANMDICNINDTSKKIDDCLCLCASSPAQRPEPGQVVGVIHTVSDCDDLLEALDLNTKDLHRETLRHQGTKLQEHQGSVFAPLTQNA